jgi:hypothetical protein
VQSGRSGDDLIAEWQAHERTRTARASSG